MRILARNSEFLFLQELELYHDVLLDKPALLAVNKMDTESAEKKFSDLLQEIANIKGNICK